LALTRPRYRLPLPDGRTLDLGTDTIVMGVLNVTPDSFSDGGLHADSDAAIARGRDMARLGAALVDVGGESTRPGAPPVPASEELSRVLPVVKALAADGVLVSIDTTKADVAAACVDAGAVMINDISGGLYDPGVLDVAARSRAALVLMHMRGHHREMYAGAVYEDVVEEVAAELSARVEAAVEAGVARDAIVLDPGIGFAKRAEHSWAVLSRLDAAPLRALDRPLLVGPSRKSFLQGAVGERPPAERDAATAAAVTAAILFGAHVVRVHDVASMVQVARVADMISATRVQPVP
jgi:dihydropteroate synthase